MRPSSSRSDPVGLFDGVLARGPVREALADHEWLSRMLEVEAALALVQANLGLIPAAAGAAIQTACDPARYEISALAAAAAGPGNPVLPLVEALRAVVGPEHATFVHFGATTQDILDTAAMLGTRDALTLVLGAVDAAAGEAARLARQHRDTAMAGRTLLQHARPTTFGLTAAGWLVALVAVSETLIETLDVPAVQLGGAVGTLDAYGGAGLDLVAQLAGVLRLTCPVLPWHTDRTRIGALAGSLALAAGAIGKVARDVTLLAGSDLGEVAEAAPGGSSAMPHKRNPVAAVSALACALQAPGLASTLFSAMVQEHQRAAGGWQAEWRPLRELLVAVGSAAEWLHQCLAGLTVDEAAMAANLARLAGTAGIADPRAGLATAGALVDQALAAHAAAGTR
jgi:3-carboxy-cis,cis-muconate cycloisomerase